MKNKYKYSIAPIVLSLVALVSGCNSEGAFTTPEPDATLFEINISPSPISTFLHIPQQLRAIATYADGSDVDISDTAEWSIITDPVNFADLTSNGLLTTKVKGVDKIIASKDGIFSPETEVTSNDLTGSYIDIFEIGSGKLFTNSPSKAFLDRISDSSATNGINPETGALGPVGVFYLFNWNNANVLCDIYNTNSISGRTNWRLPEKDELLELYTEFRRSLFSARGWPTTYDYWSVTSEDSGSTYLSMTLDYGAVYNGIPTDSIYVSCVSNP